MLALYKRVQNKVLMISKTLGIPGGKLINEDDVLDDVKVFQAFKDEYGGDMSTLEELRLKWLEMVQADPGLEELVERLPDGITTAKTGNPAGSSSAGRCRCSPRSTMTTIRPSGLSILARFAGRSYPGRCGAKPSSHRRRDRCRPETATRSFGDRSELRKALRDLERGESKQHMKETQMPMDGPSPRTICWMEVR